MGKLVEQPISTLFQGVSRQPATVRLPGQVENMTNVLPSVVTGGFESRPGSRHKAELTDLSGLSDVAFYGYNRDEVESYILVATTDDIFVYDLDGTKKTVNVADGTRYLEKETDSTTTGALASTQLNYPASETQIDLETEDFAGGLDIDVEGSSTGAFAGEEVTLWAAVTTNTTQTVTAYPYIRVVVNTGGTGTFNLKATFKDTTYLLNSEPSVDVHFATLIDYTVITNDNITVEMLPADGAASLSGTKQKFSDLPAAASSSGNTWKIAGDSTDAFLAYYVKSDGTVWTEAPDPTIPNAFDPATMPHQLVREADGTFTFQEITWSERTSGDGTIEPDPDFVGGVIRDVSFHRNRLVFLSGETLYASQSGDFFNFWPDKATDVVDSDPFGRTATMSSVQLLRFAEPFRKSLFVTSDTAQFELTSTTAVLTPKTAALENSTRYEASHRCRPVALGDTLYFVSDALTGEAQVLFEYLIDGETLASTADDVSRHAHGYLPAPVKQMCGNSESGVLAMLSEAEPNSIYLYRAYWQGNTKVQSAWFKWKLGDTTTDATILGILFIDGLLRVLVKRGGTKVFLESMPMQDEYEDEVSTFRVTNATLGKVWTPRMDRRVLVTGSYDAGTELTTWTCPYEHRDEVIVILGDSHTNPGRKLSGLAYPTSTTITASGDHSAGDAILGVPWMDDVELSTIYYRESATRTAEGAAIQRAVTSGRLQLSRIGLDYKNTGYFQAEVTPRTRDPATYTFTGRIVGDVSNVIGETPVLDKGSFRFPVGSNAETVEIHIKNDTHIPTIITSGYWWGFFNELTRQSGRA